MGSKDTARALRLIEQELTRIPDVDRSAIADRVLGALRGEFLIAPWPTGDDEMTSRADLAAMAIPGLQGRRGAA